MSDVYPDCPKNPHAKHHVWQRYFEHDETGGFIKCDWCSDCTFLDGEGIKSFLRDIADGVPASEIHDAIKSAASDYVEANRTSPNSAKPKPRKRSKGA